MRRETVDERRLRARNEAPVRPGAVLYWMQRDQRVADNWALLHARARAEAGKAPLHVLFNLAPTFGQATLRHYDFMLEGLAEVAAALARLDIGFSVTSGAPGEAIPAFAEAHGVGEVVTDFNPLALPERWKAAVAAALPVRLTEVDAHNVIPCWVASDREEYMAATFRPKVRRRLAEFLTDHPPLCRHPHGSAAAPPVDWQALRRGLDVRTDIGPVGWAAPGERAGRRALDDFLEHRLAGYAAARNDPVRDGQSGLSPWLHFGQLSAARVALAVEAARGPGRADKDAFLEELIVRRELSDNFCFYQPHHDSLRGVRGWARETLGKHARDPREHVYDAAAFEQARTHDPLWNAAQRQMVRTGRMHGYLRMYWAKKILEWSASPDEAVRVALALNDRYELDGRDPNGNVGVLWSIGGLHDRGWPERPVYGKVRSMSARGARRKFDVDAYVARHGGQ